MQGYYQQPQMGGMGGMDPRMMGQGYGQQNMMGMQGMQGMQGMNGMQGMQGGMNPMMGGMGMGGVGMGNAWRQLVRFISCMWPPRRV
jgi:protein MPE1